MATTTATISIRNRAFGETLCGFGKGCAKGKGNIGKGKGKAQELCGEVDKDREIGVEEMKKVRERLFEQQAVGERLKNSYEIRK
jgi:hypothetical protein